MSSSQRTQEVIAAAVRLAECGAHVVPCNHPMPDGNCSCGDPGHHRDSPKSSCGKHPVGLGWQDRASRDPAEVRAMFADSPGRNVSLVVSPRTNMAAVDIDSAEGERLLAELSGGEIPVTWEDRSGKGRHLFFAIPAGMTPKTESLKDANGDEALRFMCGKSAQVVVAPSRHHSGRQYEWVPGQAPWEVPLADMPGWMVAIMCPPEKKQDVGSAADPDLPGSDFNRRADFAAVIEADGWKRVRAGEKVAYYCRPGKGGGVSATLGHCTARDGTKAMYVFSGSVPHLKADRAYDLFGYVANTRYRGDFAACTKALREGEYDGVSYGKPVAQAKFNPNGQTYGGSSANGMPTGHPQRNGPHQGQRPAPWQPTIIRADQVVMRAIRWHWHGRIPAGRITLLSGRPGASKSVVTCFIAAVTTRGGLWPANEGLAPKGGVIFLAAEDDPADTVVPRLAAAGADLSKVILLDGKHAPDPNDPEKVLKLSVTLADIDQIAAALDLMPDCKLIVIDPVGSYMGGKVDSHRDTEVRSVLAPLAQLARDRNVAVLLVAHTNKAVNQFADDSVLGSRAFVGIARSVLHFTTDPEDKERKLLLPGKNNLAKELPGLAYRVEEEPMVIGRPPKIAWEDEPVHGVTADQYLGSAAGGRGDGQRGRPECDREEERTFLEELLEDQPNGVAFKFIEREAKEAGLNMKAVRKAADELEVVKKKQPANIKAGQVSKWFWGLGSDWEPPAAVVEDSRKDEPATADSPRLLNFGHLRENTAENPDFLEDARSEELRASSTADAPSGHLRDEDSRSPSTASKMPVIPDRGHLRENVGETANPVEDARNSSVLGDTPKKPRRKKTKATVSPDPITDTDALLAAVRRAGWTPTQAVEWLEAQDEFVPLSDLAGTHGGQRRKLLDHLAASKEKEVSA